MTLRQSSSVILFGAAALLLAACTRDVPPPSPPPPPPPPPLAVGATETVTASGSRTPAQAGLIYKAQSGPMLAQYAPPMPAPTYWQPADTSKFPDAKPNPVKVTAEEPVSTFSIDVDTASYGVVRSYLNRGELPPADAVRIEEMVNYFDYRYLPSREKDSPFRARRAVYPSPWNKDTQILHIGIKGYEFPTAQRPHANLVFLIDTSGSMNQPNKLPLLVRAFRLLVDQLNENDTVAIVAYAGSAGVVLEPTKGSDKAKIVAALDQLHAGGSTAGGAGLSLAYTLAKAHYQKGAVNRVLLATDGDFNVGTIDSNTLEDYVTRMRETGIYLTCLGFGNGNYQDARMQKLAQAGNGNAAFIDTLSEARKVFVQQLSGTLFTIATDVKIQVEFNPARVAEYRLIGYETRMLNRTDFKNDKVDAGDVGAGTTVTALYEITPVGSKAVMADPLRYGTAKPAAKHTNEIATISFRYKLPGAKQSKESSMAVTDADVMPDFAKLSDDMRFAAAVAGASQLLRHDPYIKDFDFDRAITIANNAKGKDEYGYRAEFVQLLRLANDISAKKPE